LARGKTNTVKLDGIRIGISACLLGQNVRYDGGNKLDDILLRTIGPLVEWVPVCPEVELGLETPREPLSLVESSAGLRMVVTKTGEDLTESMRAFARKRVSRLVREHLSGFVLKKDSPSCGLSHVKVYDSSGLSARTGQGLFAQALVRQFPDLPIEEEDRLADPAVRQSFMERVLAYHRK
jgi:uncharacterized protein YbbK (DUF523 family)